MTTVTLDLPTEVYQEAKRVAKSTKRPLEQVVVAWIQPSYSSADFLKEEFLQEMKQLTDDEVMRIAKAKMPEDDATRMTYLLELQQTRRLTRNERAEAEFLVEEEGKLTLRKACALSELKQRNLLPADIQAFLLHP